MATPDAKPYGTPPPAPSRVTVTTLAKMAAEGQHIAMLTAYDASFAALAAYVRAVKDGTFPAPEHCF